VRLATGRNAHVEQFAPAVNKLRKWRSPRLLILPSLSLPPLEFCFGTSPIHAGMSDIYDGSAVVTEAITQSAIEAAFGEPVSVLDASKTTVHAKPVPFLGLVALTIADGREQRVFLMRPCMALQLALQLGEAARQVGLRK
jgi:hypothetical protein